MLSSAISFLEGHNSKTQLLATGINSNCRSVILLGSLRRLPDLRVDSETKKTHPCEDFKRKQQPNRTQLATFAPMHLGRAITVTPVVYILAAINTSSMNMLPKVMNSFV